MATVVEHKLAEPIKETNNFPKYRFLATCVCGFQTRQATMDVARSQFEAHLYYHGLDPKTLSTPEEEKTYAREVASAEGLPRKEWVPEGVSRNNVKEEWKPATTPVSNQPQTQVQPQEQPRVITSSGFKKVGT